MEFEFEMKSDSDSKAPRRGRRFQIVDGGPYYTSYPISYYPHYLILLPTYFMAGLQIIVDESAAPWPSVSNC